MKMRALVVATLALVTTSGAHAQTFDFTDIAAGESGYALFNSGSPHVARNDEGLFGVFWRRGTAGALVETQVAWDGDDGSWRLIDSILVSASGPPCLVADPSGPLWALWPDPVSSTVHAIRWVDPTDPADQRQRFSYSSDQGQNIKFGCAFDATRDVVWFIGNGFELLAINAADGALLSLQDLGDYEYPYFPMYPSIAVDAGGALNLYWVSYGLQTGFYRTMHAMRSEDGVNWSTTGAAPYLATGSSEVDLDETGPTLNVAPEFASVHTFPNAMHVEADGTRHLFWWQANGSCLGNVLGCTLGYWRTGEDAVASFSADEESPRAAFGGAFREDESGLWYLTAYGTRVALFYTDDHGATWTLSGGAQIPDADGQCVKDASLIPTPDGFAGLITVWADTCASWASSATGDGSTRIVALAVTF